ncbi:F-box protein At5g07610-like [Henckelia pumila]|uniref:F-box protein At5g07610-like n=1 Tax=Henckelia pumila TaxID=405737 RepID=UPI003C6E2FFC
MASKRPSQSNPAETIGGIDDLLTLIFLFLPARPLIRFQLVCKRWRSLISDERFSHLHSRLHRRLRTRNRLSFILRASLPEFYYFNHVARTFRQISIGFDYPKILQSCNGLLLMECRNTPFGWKKYYVCNPTNKNIRCLAYDNKKKDVISGMCLAFDPLKSPHYKVVCVKGKEDSIFEYVLEVYDSRNHAWSSFGAPFTALPNTQFCNGIYMNDGIYWIKPRAKSCFLDLEKGSVETLPTIKFPRRKAGESHKNFVIESNGHIHCVSLYLHAKMKSVYVFELFEDNSCWVETFRAELNLISAAFPEMSDAEVNVLSIVRGDMELDAVLLLHFNNKIVSYRFWDGEFGLVFDLRTRGFARQHLLQFDRNHVFQVVESMAPV